MSQKQFDLGLAVVLITLGVTLRLLPHPANFAPMTAIAIFAGAVLPRKLALWVPLLAMMISDAFIGFYDVMPIVWACYVAITLVSNFFFLREVRVLRTVIVTLSSSLFFFIVTNFVVWVSSGMYEHNWAGLTKCYVLALPFFRDTLTSDCMYTTVFFGLLALGRINSLKHLRLTANNI